MIIVYNGGICVLENDEIIVRRCLIFLCNVVILVGNFFFLMYCIVLLVISLNILVEMCVVSKFVLYICFVFEDGYGGLVLL